MILYLGTFQMKIYKAVNKIFCQDAHFNNLPEGSFEWGLLLFREILKV